MKTLKVHFCKLPFYLRTGEFYRNLDNSDTQGFVEVPDCCFASDGSKASNVKEFRRLLRVYVYWTLDKLPRGIVSFCKRNKRDVWEKAILSLPQAASSAILTLVLDALAKTDPNQFEKLVKSGSWEEIIYMVERLDRNCDAATVAAAAGNLRLLQYLHEKRFSWNENVCLAAAKNSDLECLRYARENGCMWGEAVQLAYLETSWLMYSYSVDSCPQDVCAYAARVGRLDCLQYAHSHGCPWNSSTVLMAAVGGNFECLRYALENGCPIESDWPCGVVCLDGSVESLHILHTFRAAWTATTCSYAVGHIACLQYLHENGCPWDERTPRKAARRGQLQTLQYALERGCPYGDDLLHMAVESHYVECVQYLVEVQGLHMDESLFADALSNGDLACFQYLIDQGCPFPETQPESTRNYYAKKSRMECLQCAEFAVDRGWSPYQAFRDQIFDTLVEAWFIAEWDTSYTDYRNRLQAFWLFLNC